MNPALAAFGELVREPLVWGQVVIRPGGGGFELRHVVDREKRAEELRDVKIEGLRAISGSNAEGQFRPLKSQPDLGGGWRAECSTLEELERGLQLLYPNSVVDWFTVRASETPPVTNYREYTQRQTGMYRITQMLSDEQAAAVIRAGCHQRNCLKRRLWSVEGLEADRAETKSLIPCLEPCAVLLEFARKSMRIEQEERLAVEVKGSEFETMVAAVNRLMAVGQGLAAVGEMGSPLNPRRLQLVLEKYRKEAELNQPPQE